MQVAAKAAQALQAGRAAGQDLDVVALAQQALAAQLGFALEDFFFFAKTNLGGDVGPVQRQRASLAAAALGLQHLVAQQGFDRFDRLLLLHGAVAGVVEQKGAGVGQGNFFLQKVLMDVDDAAAGEDFVKLVALQLVKTGAAADHHGLDVQVVQGVGHAVEQHPVVGDEFFGLVKLAGSALRVATAQVARRQHGLHAGMPQHGLGG